MKKKPTIDDFCECIPDAQLRMVFSKSEFKKFGKWMEGQTIPVGGVFKHDLKRYLDGLPVID